MRESIGSIALYNIIIVFIVITFAVLAGTMSYSKAFKTNNRIINAIEKYEGYNEYSAEKIDSELMSIGYLRGGTKTCSKRRGVEALATLNENYDFCVYQIPEQTREWNGRYSTYGVVTYINIDFPFLNTFMRIPVYGQSKMVFSFDKENPPVYSDEIHQMYVELTDEAKQYIVDGCLTLNHSIDYNAYFNVYLQYDDGVTVPIIYPNYFVEEFDINKKCSMLNNESCYIKFAYKDSWYKYRYCTSK